MLFQKKKTPFDYKLSVFFIKIEFLLIKILIDSQQFIEILSNTKINYNTWKLYDLQPKHGEKIYLIFNCI